MKFRLKKDIDYIFFILNSLLIILCSVVLILNNRINLLDNEYIRVVLLSGIIYESTVDVKIALMMSFAYILAIKRNNELNSIKEVNNIKK